MLVTISRADLKITKVEWDSQKNIILEMERSINNSHTIINLILIECKHLTKQLNKNLKLVDHAIKGTCKQ